MNSLSPINVPATQDFVAAGLEPNNVLPTVIMLYPQLNPVTAITTQVSGSPEISHQYNFIRYKMGNPNTAEPVLSVTLVTGSKFATLTWANPNNQPFRVNDVIQDDITNTKAIVISNQNPGSVFVEFQSARNNATIFTSSDFAAGHFARYVGTYTDPTKNIGRATRNWTPTPTTWTIQEFADTCELTKAEMNNWTYLDTVNNAQGKPYMMRAKVHTWMQQLKVQLERMVVGNNLALGNSLNGVGCEAAGLEYQIQAGNGYYNSLSSLPTESDYQNLIEYMIDVNGSNSKEITFFAGSRAMGNFQAVTGAKYVLYPGVENTFGGQSVKGLEVKTYDYMGVTIRWVSYDLYNDRSWSASSSTIAGMNGKAMGQGSILALNTAKSFTTEGGYEPFCKRHAYGGAGIIDAMQTINGLYDINGGLAANPTSSTFASSYQFSSSFAYELTNPMNHALLKVNA